jgi:hypothetical protein
MPPIKPIVFTQFPPASWFSTAATQTQIAIVAGRPQALLPIPAEAIVAGQATIRQVKTTARARSRRRCMNVKHKVAGNFLELLLQNDRQ